MTALIDLKGWAAGQTLSNGTLAVEPEMIRAVAVE